MKEILNIVLVMIFSTHLYSQVSTNEKPISFSYPNVEYKGTIYYQPHIDMDKIAEEIREITIIDLQGKELKSFYNTEKFNISFLKNGTYIVRIKDSGNKVHYQKLVKQ